MRTFKFKQLELEQDKSWFQRTFASKHFIKTLIYSLLGALIGFAVFYFSDSRDASVLWSDEALNNVFWGIALGVFVTNSPCARGRC